MEIKQLNEFNQRMEDTLALALKEVERLKQQFQQLEQKMLPTKTEQKDTKIGPSNCQQVQENGNQLSGFHMVQEASGKIRTLYCNFGLTPGSAGYETVVGYNDVKTSLGVYFHVSRTSGFSSV